MGKIQHDQHRPAPWLFLFGTLAWTWSFLGLTALLGGGLYGFPNVILAALGGLGPLILPGILIAKGRWDPDLDKNAVAFYQRAFNPRTLTWLWTLIILGMVLVLAVGPVLLDWAVWREQGLFSAGSIFTLLIGLIFGALEEPGWRGYAQEGLQRRMPVLWASLVVGVFWALWHLPLFLIPGTYQAGLGLGSLAFWSFNLALIIGSPVYAWVYNAPGKVIFGAMLYHGMGNLMRELVPDVSNWTEVGVEAALSLAVILVAWRWITKSLPSVSIKSND
jgi:uncharacterized protein